MDNAKNVIESSPAGELLSRKEAGGGPHPPSALDHPALTLLLEAGATVENGLEALARLRREFVDWNEIRVARGQEIVRALGQFEWAEAVARRIMDEYNAFFDKKGVLSFEFIGAGKPGEARRLLTQFMPKLPKSAVSLLMYEFCPGAPLPLSEDGLKQAKKDGLAGKNADRNQLARVLAESLKPDQVCALLQYWELAAAGNPYGEAGKKEIAALAGKFAKKDKSRAAKPKAPLKDKK